MKIRKKSANPAEGGSPQSSTYVIGMVFRLRRDLSLVIRKHVLPGSGFTIEEADVLMDLYGAAKLGWPDPPSMTDGYVTMTNLRASLVHSSASLSRRVALLKKAGLVETCNAHELRSAGDDPICSPSRKEIAVAVTKTGIDRISPVYERFRATCDKLLRDISTEDQRVFLEVCDQLIASARWPVTVRS